MLNTGAKQMKSKVFVVLSMAFVLMGALSVFAHHGTGISYDQDKHITVKGIVTEFAWKNPHSQLYLDIKNEKGETVNYAVELNSPGVMTRQGWNRRIFKAGDEVVIDVHPSRVGGPVGECLNPCKVTVNGKELK
jgi:hypothetical protein